MHVISFNLNFMLIHLVWEAQIALLIAEKVKISAQCSDFSNVFLKKKVLILPKATELN